MVFAFFFYFSHVFFCLPHRFNLNEFSIWHPVIALTSHGPLNNFFFHSGCLLRIFKDSHLFKFPYAILLIKQLIRCKTSEQNFFFSRAKKITSFLSLFSCFRHIQEFCVVFSIAALAIVPLERISLSMCVLYLHSSFRYPTLKLLLITIHFFSLAWKYAKQSDSDSWFLLYFLHFLPI